MQESTQIKTLVLQLYKKGSAGGLFEFARHFYSHQAGVLVIGSDPKEHFEDYESIIRFYEANGAAGYEIRVDDLRAYSEGAVGWAVDRVTVKLPGGAEVPVRHTYVFQKESEGWRIVHAHISVPVPNESLGA